MRILQIISLAVALNAGAASAQQIPMDTLFDFRTSAAAEVLIVNDGVMGGRSSSRVEFDPSGFAVFEGDLSLENNGGFASARLPIPARSMRDASHLVLRVRGDGHRYQARLRRGRSWDGIAYTAGFDTRAGEWLVVELAIESFQPSFRGFRPRGAGPVDPAEVGQVGLMLTDKQEGPFRLEIEWIGVR
jgi:hypothetical protein